MQENNTQVTQSISEPVIQTEQPLTVQAGKQNNFLTILLSILLLLSVSIAGFFAFQTQRLVKEIEVMRLESEQKIMATSEPTIEPVATNSSMTVDPTANWKIYKNTLLKYEVSHPLEWKVVNQAAGSMGVTVDGSRYIEIGIGEGKSGTLGIEEMQMIPPSEEANLNITKKVGEMTLLCNSQYTNATKMWCWVKVPNQEKYLNIQIFKTADMTTNAVLDQIVSTFKFTH